MKEIFEELDKYIKNNFKSDIEHSFSYFGSGGGLRFKIKTILFEDEDELDDSDYYEAEPNKTTSDVRYSLSTPKEEKKIYDWEDELQYAQKRTNIEEFIKDHIEYSNFQKTLFKMIDERNLKDSDVYNKVHMDRRTFAKIRNEEYHPSKDTVILLAISLELNEKELEDLLDSASYSLPKNNNYDLIIRFCFINKIYEIDTINALLDRYNCKLFNY